MRPHVRSWRFIREVPGHGCGSPLSPYVLIVFLFHTASRTPDDRCRFEVPSSHYISLRRLTTVSLFFLACVALATQ